MLLNHSEAFYENPEMVEFIRTRDAEQPAPAAARRLRRQLEACSRHDTRDRLGASRCPRT